MAPRFKGLTATVAALALLASAAPSYALSKNEKAFILGAAIVGTAVIVQQSQCQKLSRRCDRGSMSACIKLANNC